MSFSSRSSSIMAGRPNGASRYSRKLPVYRTSARHRFLNQAMRVRMLPWPGLSQYQEFKLVVSSQLSVIRCFPADNRPPATDNRSYHAVHATERVQDRRQTNLVSRL